MPVSLPEDTPSNRAALWTAHQLTWWWRLVLLVGIASDTFRNVFLQAADLASLVGMVWTLWSTYRHGLAMCPRCAAEIPLDGPYRATRKARTLRWTHRMQTRRALVVYFLVVAATLATQFLLIGHHEAAALGSLTFYWVCLWAGTQAHLLSVHRPLQPWCPWCHWGGGGDHEPTPVPGPPQEAGTH